MTATVYLPLLGQLNKRQYPVTQDQFNSLVLSTGAVTFSSLTQALAPYLLISSLPASLAPYVLTSTLAATLATFPALSTTNVWTGKQEFKDLPWADVRAYGALGNGSHDDRAAIQSAVDHMSSAYAGGYVFFAPGSYKITGGVTIKTGVILLGSGINATAINGQGQDATAVVFDGTCANAGAYDIGVYGYANSLASTAAVTIAAGVLVNLKTCQIWLGSYGLATQGVDGRYYNCFFYGYTGCVLSSGANFYTDCKLDQTGSAPVYGFVQGQGYTTGAIENEFVSCDFSGGFTYSILIDDNATNLAYSKFVNCVISSPIRINSHAWTAFNTCEFGSTSWVLTATNPVTIVGSNSLGGAVTLGGANVILSGNYQITS